MTRPSYPRPARCAPRTRLLYNSRVIKRLMPLALALAAALTMPQAAPAQAVPDERVAAREFAYAAYRLRVEIRATESRARRATAMYDVRECSSALGSPEDADLERLSFRALSGIGVVLSQLDIADLYGHSGRLLPGFVAELDRVATADRVLIAGREAWRSTAELLRHARPLPRDACAQIRRWRLAGYPADGMPALQPAPIRDALVEQWRQPLSADSKPDRSPERAAERMVKLGVGKGQARRFAGLTLFDGLPARF
jgi:hypothetical protein